MEGDFCCLSHVSHMDIAAAGGVGEKSLLQNTVHMESMARPFTWVILAVRETGVVAWGVWS